MISGEIQSLKGFLSQFKANSLNVWFNSCPTLWWPPRITRPSKLLSIQNKTLGSQLSTVPSDFHWDLQSPLWSRVFLRLVGCPLSSMLLLRFDLCLSFPASIHFRASIHCCCRDCNSLTAQLDFLPQYSVTTENLAGTSSVPYAAVSPLLLLSRNHLEKYLQGYWFPRFEGENQGIVPFIWRCPKLLERSIFPPFMTDPKINEGAEPLWELSASN